MTKPPQIKTRYGRHYLECDDFVIEAYHPNLVKIVIKPNEAADILGDLLKYVFANCKQLGDED